MALRQLAGRYGRETAAIDLLDGRTEARRIGAASISQRPGKFSAIVVGYLIGGGLITIPGWVSVISEWNRDYRVPLKPPIDDPDRRRPM